MPKQTDKLTASVVKSAEPRKTQYKLHDGAGLFLLVSPKGGKWWRFKYRFEGREKLISLGTYPTISLDHARYLRKNAQALLSQGEDPSTVRKREKAEQSKAEGKLMLSVRYLMDGSIELMKGRHVVHLTPDEARFVANQLSTIARYPNAVD